MAHEWNIKPRGRVCAVCSKEYKPGEDCVSALFETTEGFERRDYCPECWKTRTDGGDPFSQWQGSITPPQSQSGRDEPIKRETAEALLRRLVELDDPANINVIYILAVMLHRKKQLVERDAKVRPEGGILRIYEQKSTGDTFIVIDPQLRLDAIGDVQKQVIELLS